MLAVPVGCRSRRRAPHPKLRKWDDDDWKLDVLGFAAWFTISP